MCLAKEMDLLNFSFPVGWPRGDGSRPSTTQTENEVRRYQWLPFYPRGQYSWEKPSLQLPPLSKEPQNHSSMSAPSPSGMS